jgi:hypothetical protein
MLTEWRPIRDFPGYSVSDTGLVRNDEADRIMAMLVNQAGVVNVGLTRNRTQYKRAVALLVAKAFLEKPKIEIFDCAINLDGDRFNNHADNLAWRPRWFATKYFQQFQHDHFDIHFPVEEMDIQEKFDSPWEAAIRFGLLQVDVMLSALNQVSVWPTMQRFRLIG